jgi:putative transposase
MLAAALEAEVQAYIATHGELVDEHGHRLVVRNGHAPARTITAGVGQVEVVRPRVEDRRTDPATGERMQFQSVLCPGGAGVAPRVAEVLPLLYCTACRAWTSCRRWRRSSARARACRPRR